MGEASLETASNEQIVRMVEDCILPSDPNAHMGSPEHIGVPRELFVSQGQDSTVLKVGDKIVKVYSDINARSSMIERDLSFEEVSQYKDMITYANKKAEGKRFMGVVKISFNEIDEIKFSDKLNAVITISDYIKSPTIKVPDTITSMVRYEIEDFLAKIFNKGIWSGLSEDNFKIVRDGIGFKVIVTDLLDVISGHLIDVDSLS